MQQIGGSIGTSALSTIALSAAATYLIGHPTGPRAAAVAATHGYTIAFGVSAGLLGLGCILTIVLLPSRRRRADLNATPTAPAPTPPAARSEAIPVALCSCSPVITTVAGSSGGADI